LLSCVVGNLLSACGFFATQESLPLVQVIVSVLTSPATSLELLIATFSPMDLLFYGIAVYEGYKISLQSMAPQKPA
jgi:hypothetical protein